MNYVIYSIIETLFVTWYLLQHESETIQILSFTVFKLISDIIFVYGIVIR